ncbi:MAG TPA: TolC family protein [Gemmatimonadaceae bacterium]
MRKLWCALLLVGTALPAAGQGAAGPTLSLSDALSLAKANNPTYLQSTNGRRRADATLRAANGQFLPSASTNFGAGYRQGKQQYFDGVAFGSNSATLSSDWGLTFSENVSLGAFNQRNAARLNVMASETDVTAADQNLRFIVTSQYFLVLEDQAQAKLQDTLVALNQLQLDLANAKAGVGSATSLDVRQAQVALGTQQVAALRARNTAAVDLLTLFQNIGIPPQLDVQLSTIPPVNEPKFDLKQLVADAIQANPTLAGLIARSQSAHQSYLGQRGQYSPTLSLSASFGGTSQQYTDNNYVVDQAQQSLASSQAQCFQQDSLRRGAGLSGIPTCSSLVLTPAQASQLRSQNQAFPFKFASNPYTLSLGLNFPLFNGFVREQQIESSAADQSDAEFNLKAQQLRLTATVQAANITLIADYQALKLQEANSVAARDALQLAEERYRVGLNSLVDLQQSRSAYETAEAGRINAVFEFHRAFAALESAVGRPLR